MMPHTNRRVQVEYNRDGFNRVCEILIGSLGHYVIEKNDEGYIIKERKMDVRNGTYAVTAKVSYINGEVIIDAKCGGIGPIQNNHVNQVADAISSLINKGPNNRDFNNFTDDDVIRCPMCGCTQIQLQKRGWSAAFGIIGSGKNERVCMKCLHRF